MPLRSNGSIAGFVRRLRPDPVAAGIARVLGLSKRRVITTRYGRYLADPMSRFGQTIQNGEYEPSLAGVLNKYLEPGGMFIDLGANEGYFSVIASARVGPSGSVIAVEPQTRLQDILRANLRLNGCQNVRVAKAAISAKTQHVRLHLAAGLNNGGSSLFRPTRYPLPSEDVECFTLADFLRRNQVDRCDLMKVDIEGAEYDVFIDAGEVLRRGVIRNIALDIHHRHLERRGLSGDKLHAWILACGYRLNDQLGFWVYSSTCPSRISQ
jgi:FkbM family methyltransferase